MMATSGFCQRTLARIVLAVAVDQPERRRVAEKEFGGVRTAAAPAAAQVEHQPVGILERALGQRFGDGRSWNCAPASVHSRI